MPIRVFQYPLPAPPELDDLNAFLASHRVALDEFDRGMKATGLLPRYIRYMDDVVVWADSDTLPTIRDRAALLLESLGLRIKHDGEWNRCERGVPFVGFVVYPDRIRLGAAGRKRLRRKFNGLERSWVRGGVDDAELQSRATALFAHVAHGDDVAWRRMVLERSRYDIEIQAEGGCPKIRAEKVVAGARVRFNGNSGVESTGG